jgi:hypothetical protein
MNLQVHVTQVVASENDPHFLSLVAGDLTGQIVGCQPQDET